MNRKWLFVFSVCFDMGLLFLRSVEKTQYEPPPWTTISYAPGTYPPQVNFPVDLVGGTQICSWPFQWLTVKASDDARTDECCYFALLHLETAAVDLAGAGLNLLCYFVTAVLFAATAVRLGPFVSGRFSIKTASVLLAIIAVHAAVLQHKTQLKSFDRSTLFVLADELHSIASPLALLVCYVAIYSLFHPRASFSTVMAVARGKRS